MSGLVELARRAIHLGPYLAAEKAVTLVGRKAAHARTQIRDRLLPTYGASQNSSSGLLRYCESVPAMDASDWPQRHEIVEHYLQHRFDLLGSGWLQVRHGMNCPGVEGHRYNSGPAIDADRDGEWLRGRINHANLAGSRQVWRAIDGDYRPIDWHLDFKSGYRWAEDTWHDNTPFAHLPGVDIKVPWELARMQHLPQMALAAAASRKFNEGEAWASRVESEFRNQVLDFIACNPPRYGVNWRCAMDVGIRAANWLVAYDLFRAGGMRASEPFDSIFARSVAEHGQHLIGNLEWQRQHRSNHYLADITGLLFVAAYLPRSPRVDAWLALAVRQLVAEIPRQFTPDGANFEASTSYHRLSAEMAVFGSALILALGDDKLAALENYNHRWVRGQPHLERSPVPRYLLPIGRGLSPLTPACWVRLDRMAEFSRDVTKLDGAVHQVGDNDSGRFLKLWPTYRRLTVAVARERYANLGNFRALDDHAVYWDEDHLDHRGMIAAAGALTGKDELLKLCDGRWPENALVRDLAGAKGHVTEEYCRRNRSASAQIGGAKNNAEHLTSQRSAVTENSQVCRIELPSGVTADLAAIAYPDFGLFIWRGARMYLAVRCGPVGQEGNGGHAHNDQLAMELQIDGEDWISDAGTYLYTPSPSLRNRYRSVAAHFTPQADPPREPASLDVATFLLPDTALAKCLQFDERSFCGMHEGFGQSIRRQIEIHESEIVITDAAKFPLKLKALPNVSRRWSPSTGICPSPGYGIARAA